MLLKKGIAAEGRGDWDQALLIFEQVIQGADSEEEVELARQHISNIQTKRSTPPGAL